LSVYHGYGSFKLIPVPDNKKQQDKSRSNGYIQMVPDVKANIKSDNDYTASNGKISGPGFKKPQTCQGYNVYDGQQTKDINAWLVSFGNWIKNSGLAVNILYKAKQLPENISKMNRVKNGNFIHQPG
jgi:hypothetical protein